MDGNSTDSSCYPRIIWWLFPVISMWLYTAGLIATILYTVLARVGLSEGVQVNLLKLRNKVSYILSPMNSLLGKVLYTLIFLANVVYLSLAVYRTTQPVYQCVTLFSPTLVVELFVTIFLFLHFFLRLLAAESFLFHWLSILNIVDVLTIFQPLLSLIIGYDWLGLRTLRFLWLTETSKFIHLLPFKNSEDVSQVCKILSQFLGLWLAASGVIQLLESSGDLWNHDDSQHGITFWTSAYFTMVTLSTVGYGDVTMTTVCGRIFITFFIMTGLAVYAVALPTLVDVTLTSFRASRFRRKYTASRYGESILVCGHITAQSVESFLKELLHPDKHDKHTNVLFLHPTSPSSDLRQVLKTYYTRVQFLIGTPLSTKDLHKCQINEAKALIVLADRECLDPIEEDRANLLRAIAVKNTYRPLRVILQLLCHSSKDMLTSIPGWDPKQDVVLCLNELKFNILAQTCITPGFCALVSNLFFATTVHQMASRPGPQLSWKQLYISGACNEVYSTLLSQSFYGMKIGEVARICFEDLGLTLLAIDQDDYYTMNHVIQENATGYFIADTAQDVLKANFYCCSCHTRIIDHSYFDPCACSFDIPSSVPLHHLHSTPILTSPFTVVSLSPQIHLSSNPLFPPIPPTALRNHIVLCVFATKDSTTIGLSCFVTPLQTSSHSIVIITDPTYMAKEWSTMSSHSHIYCVPGSPLDWDCLKKARIAFSSVCVVLSVPAKYKDMRYV